MVHPLLADRFKVALHHEIREIPVYALVVAKPGEFGPNLRRDENCDPGSKDIIRSAPGSPEAAEPMACGADGFNSAHLWARGMTLNYSWSKPPNPSTIANTMNISRTNPSYIACRVKGTYSSTFAPTRPGCSTTNTTLIQSNASTLTLKRVALSRHAL